MELENVYSGADVFICREGTHYYIFNFDPLRIDTCRYNIIEVPLFFLSNVVVSKLKKAKEPINLLEFEHEYICKKGFNSSKRKKESDPTIVKKGNQI